MNTSSKVFRKRNALVAAAVCCALAAAPSWGQTAFGSSTTIVVPLVSNTATFTSTVWVYNPNGADVTVGVDYFDANNTATPGPKVCGDIVVPANGTVQFTLPSACTLEPGSHFGQMIVSDTAGTNPIFAYVRTQSTANAGLSVEGFPSANFATDTTNVTGLRGKNVDQSLTTYQSNCFVGAQADAVDYVIRLFDAAGAQVGSDVSGSLNAFEQVRYLNVFAAAATSPDTEFENVRAEFTRTSAGTQQMIGFCTVQDNATFSADFRIAKTMTPPPAPPSDLALLATWNGAIQTLLPGTGVFEFVGSTSVTLGATTNVAAYGGGWFAKQSAGPGTLELGVCSQNQAGPGPITVLGSTTTVSVTSSEIFRSAGGSGTLAAGTYTIGLCAQNVGFNSVNKNGNSSGFVFETP